MDLCSLELVNLPTAQLPNRPALVVIAAVAEAPGQPADRLIGRGLELPWHLPTDLRRFKALTLGHPLVMGRRTYDSLVHQFGGPLPGRTTVVLSRTPEAVDAPPGGFAAASLDDALAGIEARRVPGRETVFIGGGADVYGAVLGADGGPPRADRLELTLVEGAFEGDTFFPPYRHLLADAGGPYVRAATDVHPAEGGRPAFRFETFERTG